MDVEDDWARLGRTSFVLTGGRRGRSLRDVRGATLAAKLATVLFEDATWPMVEVRAEGWVDSSERARAAMVRYHPTERRRLLVLFVDESQQWSVIQDANRPITVALATQAAVRFVARDPLPQHQQLEPIEALGAERILAHPERTRMVGCDCGGLRLRAPEVGWTFCWREGIDPQRRYRSHWRGKPLTRRERVVEAIENLTFGLI